MCRQNSYKPVIGVHVHVHVVCVSWKQGHLCTCTHIGSQTLTYQIIFEFGGVIDISKSI